jgi:hypothetical protein
MSQITNFDIGYFPVRSEKFKEANKTRNKQIYGHVKWIVRSPGNDLLDFYDTQNELLGKENRAYSAIPPSIVYHYRFEHQYPTELFNKSKNYGRFAYLRDKLNSYHNTSDPTYWAQIYKSRYNWLVNSPHKEFVFETKYESLQFLSQMTEQKAIRNQLSVHTITGTIKKEKLEQMFWRGKAQGWSIIVKK